MEVQKTALIEMSFNILLHQFPKTWKSGENRRKRDTKEQRKLKTFST